MHFLFVGFALWLAAAWAQTPTGAIEGTITDPSGAVVQNAKVTVTEVATGRVIPLETNELGRYSARNLLPGVYDLRIETPSLSTKEIHNLKVSSGSVVNGNAALEIGRIGEIIQVQAEAVTVDTTRQTVDTIITQKEIAAIPLFSRNFLDLAALAPGVHIRDGGAIDPTKEFAYRTVGINGRSGTGTRVQVDGIDVTDETVGSTLANFSQDAIDEFQLTRSSLDPSTSLTSSGAISIITRSGGNEIHGRGFWDYHNQDMGARLEYNATEVPFKRNRFGASVGGPFVKDRVFWFANWERHYITAQDTVRIPEFPSLNVDQNFPAGIRYSSGRMDWNVSNSTRVFYRLNNDWNIATGGNALSPFQNVNWTNQHVVGLNYNRSRMTHNYRFGFTNFNNRIESQELNTRFLRTATGVPFNLALGPIGGYGPNGLAPQQTYQDNWQNSYEGSYFKGKHTIRFGAGLTHIDLGGFANFAGPLSVSGTYDAATIQAVRARGANVQNPLEYPLEYFTTGPNAGFFTLRAGHNLPYGGKINNRGWLYGQDSWKMNRHLTLNFGLRWQYDSGYFNNDKRVKRDPNMEKFGLGFSAFPSAPKDLFSPSFGIAWDPTGMSKTVIRGGFYKAYEMNIYNNLLFDEFAMLPVGIGPDVYDYTHVAGPDGRPINVDGRHPDGNYSDLEGQPLRNVVDLIGRVHQALGAAYANHKFDPATGTPQFTQNRGLVFGGNFPGNQFTVPYAIQFNLGVQHELRPGSVLTVDYLHSNAVGLPFFLVDFERRRDAATLNVANTRNQINRVLAGRTMDQYIAGRGTLGDLDLIGETTFQGLNPDFTRARFFQGGFTRYRGLQFSFRSRKTQFSALRDIIMGAGYAFGRSESASAAGRVEFLNSPFSNREWNNKANFGPNGLDFTHYLRVYSNFTTPGGFQLGSYWTFRSASPFTLGVPNLGGAVSGVQGYFSTDINGDGSAGTSPRFDPVPGLGVGQFGRKVKSFTELNQILTQFNQNFAGKLTPHGQALVSAGLISEAQLRALGAVTQTIPLAHASAPWPFHNQLVTDVRLSRPVNLAKLREGLSVMPFFDVFNLFNHAPNAPYGDLAGRFGSYNFDYSQPGRQVGDLYQQTHRLNTTRRFQVGVRVDF